MTDELDIYALIRKCRSELLSGDADQADRLIDTYRTVWATISGLLDDLNQQIGEARANGETVSLAWLYRQDRYKALLEQADTAIDAWSAAAAGLITARQANAILLGQTHAEALTLAQIAAPLDRATVAATWNRLPHAALSHLVGAMGDGTPLADRFAQLAPAGVEAIRTAIVQGFVIGKGPRAMAEDVTNAASVPLQNALMISRTETLRAYRESQRETWLANEDWVGSWIWVCSFSSRTCFPAGTTVTTSRGPVKIEHVQIGDRVLTHRGAYMPVAESLSRKYAGTMYTISDRDGCVTATEEHPFLVQRNGRLDWVKARDLVVSDIVFRQRKSVSEIKNHFNTRLTVKGSIRQANNLVPVCFQHSRLFGILGNCFRCAVPVNAVNLKDDRLARQKEIDRVSRKRKNVFLRKVDTKLAKAKPRVHFWERLPRVSTIADRRTKASFIKFRRNNSENLVTRQAFCLVNRPATFFRAMLATSSGHSKNSTATRTWDMDGTCMRAFDRTILSICSLVRRVLLTAISAGTAEAFCGRFATSPTILRSFYRMRPKGTTTRLARPFDPRRRNRSSPRVRTGFLKGSIAHVSAELPAAFSDPGSRAFEDNPALLASSFHKSIISNIATHTKIERVFNLEIKGHQTFVANGFVVHNCAACLSMNGTEHPLTEPMASHVCCRCVQSPSLGPREDGVERGPKYESGDDWLRRQSVEIQENILGKAGAKAFRAGTLTLKNFTGLKHSDKWGSAVYVRSLKGALKNAGIVPAPTAPPAPIVPAPTTPVMDALSQQLFGSRTVNFSYAAGEEAACRVYETSFFGRHLSESDYAEIVAAPSGSTITVQKDGWFDKININVDHPLYEYTQERSIRRTSGKIVMENEYWVVRSGSPPGLATRVIGRQVYMARKIGVDQIDVHAAGNFGHPVFNGYYTWPRLGFNVPLDAYEQRLDSDSFPNVKDTNELFSRPGGPEWWKKHGGDCFGEFDLDPRSVSSIELEKYLKAKGAIPYD